MSSLQLTKAPVDNFLTSHLGCIKFLKELALVAGTDLGGHQACKGCRCYLFGALSTLLS